MANINKFWKSYAGSTAMRVVTKERDEARAEVAHLRALIEGAPHDRDCRSHHAVLDPAGVARHFGCSCAVGQWKSRASKGPADWR